MPVASDPLEVMLPVFPPLQVTLATCEAPVVFGIANTTIPSSLAVPLTSIVVFVAVMMASPLDCIRRPTLLLPAGLDALLTVTLSAVMVMGALVEVTPVVLSALIAAPGPTVAPCAIKRLIGASLLVV